MLSREVCLGKNSLYSSLRFPEVTVDHIRKPGSFMLGPQLLPESPSLTSTLNVMLWGTWLDQSTEHATLDLRVQKAPHSL